MMKQYNDINLKLFNYFYKHGRKIKSFLWGCVKSIDYGIDILSIVVLAIVTYGVLINSANGLSKTLMVVCFLNTLYKYFYAFMEK